MCGRRAGVSHRATGNPGHHWHCQCHSTGTASGSGTGTGRVDTHNSGLRLRIAELEARGRYLTPRLSVSKQVQLYSSVHATDCINSPPSSNDICTLDKNVSQKVIFEIGQRPVIGVLLERGIIFCRPYPLAGDPNNYIFFGRIQIKSTVKGRQIES